MRNKISGTNSAFRSSKIQHLILVISPAGVRKIELGTCCDGWYLDFPDNWFGRVIDPDDTQGITDMLLEEHIDAKEATTIAAGVSYLCEHMTDK